MFGVEGQKVAGAVLFTLILLWGSGIIAERVIPPMVKESGPPAPGTAPAPSQAAANGAAELPFEQMLARADAKAGATVSKKCSSCHSFESGGPNRIGPSLAGVVGRKVASVAGFAYSPALQQYGGTWTPDRLNTFLAKPSREVPGTRMTFAGLSDVRERADMIAYLHSLSPGAPPLPPEAPQTAGQGEKEKPTQ